MLGDSCRVFGKYDELESSRVQRSRSCEGSSEERERTCKVYSSALKFRIEW